MFLGSTNGVAYHGKEYTRFLHEFLLVNDEHQPNAASKPYLSNAML